MPIHLYNERNCQRFPEHAYCLRVLKEEQEKYAHTDMQPVRSWQDNLTCMNYLQATGNLEQDTLDINIWCHADGWSCSEIDLIGRINIFLSHPL